MTSQIDNTIQENSVISSCKQAEAPIDEEKEKLQGKPSQMQEFLSSFKCNCPLFPNDFGIVITAKRNEKLGNVFRKIIQSRIMSIPIVDNLSKKPVYVLSVMHIVEFLINHLSEDDFRDNFWNKIYSWWGKGSSFEFMETPLSKLEECIDYSLDPANLIGEQSTLAEATKLMVDSECHRLMVMNEDGDLVNVITQSKIIQFICSMLTVTILINRLTLIKYG
jgi:CBS domain-containing protein